MHAVQNGQEGVEVVESTVAIRQHSADHAGSVGIVGVRSPEQSEKNLAFGSRGKLVDVGVEQAGQFGPKLADVPDGDVEDLRHLGIDRADRTIAAADIEDTGIDQDRVQAIDFEVALVGAEQAGGDHHIDLVPLLLLEKGEHLLDVSATQSAFGSRWESGHFISSFSWGCFVLLSQ